MEQQARETEARARSLCNTAIEKVRRAEMRAEAAEHANRTKAAASSAYDDVLEIATPAPPNVPDRSGPGPNPSARPLPRANVTYPNASGQ